MKYKIRNLLTKGCHSLRSKRAKFSKRFNGQLETITREPLRLTLNFMPSVYGKFLHTHTKRYADRKKQLDELKSLIEEWLKSKSYGFEPQKIITNRKKKKELKEGQ